MSGTAPPASKADTFLISCIDPRFVDDVTFRFAALGRTNRYSEMRIAGAALAFIDAARPAWQAALWENLAATRQLHGIRNVTLLNHRDCGAMDLWAGRRLADDPAEELRIHTEVLNQAADAIRTRHPDLLIELKLMNKDGSTIRPPCRNCIPTGFIPGPAGADGLPAPGAAPDSAPNPARPGREPAERLADLARLRRRAGPLDRAGETALLASGITDAGLDAEAARGALAMVLGAEPPPAMIEADTIAYLRSRADAAGRIGSRDLEEAAALHRSRQGGTRAENLARAARLAAEAGMAPRPEGVWPFRSTGWFDGARAAVPAFALALSMLLGGCALEQTIAAHAVAYNHSVERSADTQLMVNVLRARDLAPLHFTTIGNIRGGFGLGAGIGYDGSTGLGNGVLANLSASTSPGFDIGPLDRQEFARGLMRPLDPALLRVLWDRNMPDSLLIHLLVSRFDEGPGGRRAINDPALRHSLTPEQRAACAEQGLDAPPPCDRFEAVVTQLTRHGPILFNGYTRLVPLGPRLTHAEATAAEFLASFREPGLTLRPEGAGWQLMRIVDQMALCIPGPRDAAGRRRYTAHAVDRDAPQISPMPQDGDVCLADEVIDRPPAIARGAAPGMSWYLRSVEEVLQYLGAVQRREEEGVPFRIAIRGAAGETLEPRLFRLWRQRPERARLSADYAGARYWVAEHAAAEDLTLRILALTTQLLNLQKAAGDVAGANTLRLVR